MADHVLPADPLPDTERDVAILDLCENERAAALIAEHFKRHEWNEQVAAFMERGWMERNEQFAAGDRDAWMTHHLARRRAEADANKQRLASDSRARAENDEQAAALVRANAREVEDRGGSAAPRLSRRAARLDLRARLTRVRALIVRALTPPLRSRSREHRAAPSRRSARAARGAPSGDPDEPEPPGGRR